MLERPGPLSVSITLIGLFAASLVCAASFAAPGRSLDPSYYVDPKPIIFVHGFSGSGAQYETQALRWASNGYPELVTAIDRTGASFPTRWTRSSTRCSTRPDISRSTCSRIPSARS